MERFQFTDSFTEILLRLFDFALEVWVVLSSSSTPPIPPPGFLYFSFSFFFFGFCSEECRLHISRTICLLLCGYMKTQRWPKINDYDSAVRIVGNNDGIYNFIFFIFFPFRRSFSGKRWRLMTLNFSSYSSAFVFVLSLSSWRETK